MLNLSTEMETKKPKNQNISKIVNCNRWGIKLLTSLNYIFYTNLLLKIF